MWVAAPFPFHVLRGSQAYLGLLEDDYYYYAIVADKLITTGKLTYDGVTLTNGFHPLWFLIILATRFVCGRFGAAFYVALTLLFVACAVATFELGRRFARALGASAALSSAIAAAYSLGNAKLITMGMEAAVAVPLFLWFLSEAASSAPLVPRRAAKLGFLASLAILGRLDIAFAVALLIAGYLVLERPPLERAARLLAAFAAGGLLVPVYAAANLFAFGSILPVSALAKQLITRPGFSLWYARYAAFHTVFGPTISVLLPLGVLALVRTRSRETGASLTARFVGGVTLLFTALYYSLNALTGWTFFGWYAYPLSAATIAALVFIVDWATPVVRNRRAAVAAIAAGVASTPFLSAYYFVTHGPLWSINDNSLLSMSFDLDRHLRGKTGLFSMGAIAGIATYVIDKPVFQLEGLMSDRKLIDHVRREDSLPQVLEENGVDYLIVSLAYEKLEKHDGCYPVTQPNAVWAGKRSAKMRGGICSEPVEHFLTRQGTNPWSIFPDLETYVFDVRKPRRATGE
jgi:hypothetical protein